MTIDREKLRSSQGQDFKSSDLKSNLKSQTLKFLLSLFIIFHLSVIIILANGGSYLGRSLQKYLLPYANTIGLNTTWNFFSPDPAHTMYIRYVQHFDDENGNEIKESVESYIPAEKEKISIDSSKRRFLYAIRFLLLDTTRMNTILAPWLCKSNPEASSIFIEQIFEAIPGLDRAAMGYESGERTVLDASVTNMQYSYDCRNGRATE